MAVTLLRERFTSQQRLDLSRLICVLPTTRGTRRLEALLRAEAESHDLQYEWPEIITVGQLAERLYQPELPAALEFEQTLAWARVLRDMHPDDLQPLITTVPTPEPIGPWLELAGMLRRLHEELSTSQLSFRDVVEVAETDTEQRRWRLLSTIFDRYQASLTVAGLADPHLSRVQAVSQNRCYTDRTVVLIGTSDLSSAMITMLRSLDSELISIIAAPASESARFDEFGCVDTSRWMDHQLTMEDHHLVAAGDIADQATAVAESLAEFAERYSADQVTIGVTDESQVGPVEVELRGCGVTTFRHLGWTVAETAVGRLLNLTATYLQRRTWQALAALVRHADVSALVSRRLGQSDSSVWLTQLDQMLHDHYPVHVRDRLPPQAIASYPIAKAVGDQIEDWLSLFANHELSIAQWSQAIGSWLDELFKSENTSFTLPTGESGSQARRGLHPAVTASDLAAAHGGDKKTQFQNSRSLSTRRTQLAFTAARKLIERFSTLNDRLDLTVTGAAAIEMLGGRLGDVRIVDTPKPDDVEILGWLDLSLDDAPAMTVVGLNHPFVPGAITSDPFLPGSLRTRLRMADNDRRYARDVYAMHLMLSARQDIRFIVGKSGADRSPTPPSRLLAAAALDDAARRVRKLLGERRPRVIVRHRWDEGPDRNSLPIPNIGNSSGEEMVKTMSVTAFRDYLVCPYRFYLRHVLKLKPLDDATGELAANQFGDLVHGSLERFGKSTDVDETDPSKIEAMLLHHLHDYATEFYGDAASTAVALQIVQAERRLKAVAKAQSQRAAEGWKIHATEASVNEQSGAGIEVDGKRMGLRGRFDRIDFHPETGRWAILDYKTHGHKPEKKHLKKTEHGEQWIDLQLPLYRMMIPFLGIDAPPSEVGLGYFNVSERDEETRINIAEFSETQMQQAEELICDCIRAIWAQEFAPTSDRVAFDDYAMILQVGTANQMLDQVDAFGEEG